MPSDMRVAYDQAASAWVDGAERVYAQFADTLVAAAPVPLAGAIVLDLGAGTGVAGRAALAAGATSVVAVDQARRMLLHGGAAIRAVQGDAAALPFASESFSLVVAALSLGHVPDPVRALREARRVGVAIVASAFLAGWTHPAKAAVDQALVPFGFRVPDWYEQLKRDVDPHVASPDRLHTSAVAAGYRDVRVQTIEVNTGLRTPAELADWRLSMAHLAPFVGSLAPPQRAAARRAAEATLVDAPPLVVPLLVLAAR